MNIPGIVHQRILHDMNKYIRHLNHQLYKFLRIDKDDLNILNPVINHEKSFKIITNHLKS